MKPKSLLLSLLWCSFTVEKQHQQQSHSYGKQFFNLLKNTVSTLFTFALAFTMPQVSGSYLHKDKKCLQKVKLYNLLFSGRVKY